MSLLADTEYALALTHGVALASLNNFQNQIGQQNRRVVGGKTYPVGISSSVLDLFPVRTALLSGRERGDGFINQVWVLRLATYGVKYLLNTYLSNLTVVSAAVTIYTRRHELDSYARYNAYLIAPSAAAGDITYVRSNVFDVRLRFTNLEAP